MTELQFDAIIIGGSAAGLSAAQALGRSLRSVLVIDGGQPRNRFADHMHNVLGHDGVSPSELRARGRAEAEKYGVEFLDARVVSVQDASAASINGAAGVAGGAFDGALGGEHGDASNGEPGGVAGRDAGGVTGRDAGVASRAALVNEAGMAVEVLLDDGSRVRARGLVLATGLVDELPDIDGLAERWGSSVLHCPYCHGWEVRGQRIGVLATSPMSMHQVKLLRQWSDQVVAFTHGLGPIDDATRERLMARGIELVPEQVVEVVGDGERVTAARTSSGLQVPLDAIFTAGTLIPRDEMLDGLALERATGPFGEVLAIDVTGLTSHLRIWAAGNVVAPAATVPQAMAAGVMAGAALNFALVEEDFDLALVVTNSAVAAGQARGTSHE